MDRVRSLFHSNFKTHLASGELTFPTPKSEMIYLESSVVTQLKLWIRWEWGGTPKHSRTHSHTLHSRIKIRKIKEKAAGEEEATVCSPQALQFGIYFHFSAGAAGVCVPKELIIEEKGALSTPATLSQFVCGISGTAVCVRVSFAAVWVCVCVCIEHLQRDNVNDHFWHEAVGGKLGGNSPWLTSPVPSKLLVSFSFCQCTFPYFPHGGVKALNACHTLSTSGDLFSTFVCKHR